VSWADNYIAKLQSGVGVQFRPRGNSMTPHIVSGALVTVEPLTAPPVSGDIVLCRVAGSQYLHFVTAVRSVPPSKDDKPRQQFQIGNAHGRINGWTGIDKIYGKVVGVAE
jgi:Peptidase S24-like